MLYVRPDIILVLCVRPGIMRVLCARPVPGSKGYLIIKRTPQEGQAENDMKSGN